MIRKPQEREGERKTNEKHEKYIIFMLKNAHTDNYLILTNDASSSPIADKSLFAVISLCEKKTLLGWESNPRYPSTNCKSGTITIALHVTLPKSWLRNAIKFLSKTNKMKSEYFKSMTHS